MNEPLRTAVVGVGHMGRHHARLYHELEASQLVAVVDTNAARAREHGDKHDVPGLTDLDQLLEMRPDAVTVAVPTVRHEAVATALMEAGVAVLVEKPLAPDSATAARLLAVARRKDCTLAVGHSERFNPVVMALDRLGVRPRFVEAHRISPFTFRSADIGVVFDMMIHDIDIVLHLVRPCRASDHDLREEEPLHGKARANDPRPVGGDSSGDGRPSYKVHAVGVSVLSKQEDIANARIQFDDGCVVNLTASRLAMKTERKIRVFSPDAYLSMDFGKKSGIAINKDANLDLLRMAKEKDLTDLSQVAGLDFGKMINVEPLVIDDVEPLRAELTAFLEAVRTKTAPPVSAEDGLAAIELAEAIVASVREHVWDRGPM